MLPAAPDQDEADVTLPLSRTLADFPLRMAEVISTLAQVERRREDEVIRDLLNTDAACSAITKRPALATRTAPFLDVGDAVHLTMGWKIASCVP